LPSGLADWKQFGADIYYLLNDPGVPRVQIKSSNPKPPLNTVKIGAQHLDEIPAGLACLTPKVFLPFVQSSNLTLYPVINFDGRNYPVTVDNDLLRHSRAGVNYNDSWGLSHPDKPKEIEAVERNIRHLHEDEPFDLGVSAHQDSTSPGQGLFYMDGFDSDQVDTFADLFRPEFRHYLIKSPSEVQLYGGYSRHGFIVEGSCDLGTYETWLLSLGIRCICIEAPYLASQELVNNFISHALICLVQSLGLCYNP